MRLRHNIAWMMAGQAAFALCQWGKLIALARLGGVETVGQFALALAIATPIMQFGGLQMRQVLVADAIGRFSFDSYRAVRSLSISVALLGVVAIALWIDGFGEVAAVIASISLAKLFESLSDLHYGLEQRHQRLDLVAQSMMLRGVLTLAALLLTFWLTANLVLAALSWAAASAIVWGLFDCRKSRPWRLTRWARPDLRQLWPLAGLGLPLGVTMLLASLNVNIPRYFIEGFMGSEELGLFAAMAYFVTAGRMLAVSLCQAASPRLADAFAAHKLRSFRRLLLQVLGLSALIGLAGVIVGGVFAEDVLRLFYGAEFVGGANALLWIMITGLVVYTATPLGVALTAMQRFTIQPVLFLAVIAANTLACLLLVPIYGILGAVLGWLAASLCQLLLSAGVCWRDFQRAQRGGAHVGTLSAH